MMGPSKLSESTTMPESESTTLFFFELLTFGLGRGLGLDRALPRLHS